MKTSLEWWNETKQSEEKLIGWLKKQYTGEVFAAVRVAELTQKAPNKKAAGLLSVIATQESQHANWIKDLLDARGVEVEVGDPNTRYWKETLPAIEDFITACAVGSHAENMRLERIKVIVDDEKSPKDIRDVFTRILAEESFHARAFTRMTTKEAIEATKDNHLRGLNSLGLVV